MAKTKYIFHLTESQRIATEAAFQQAEAAYLAGEPGIIIGQINNDFDHADTGGRHCSFAFIPHEMAVEIRRVMGHPTPEAD